MAAISSAAAHHRARIGALSRDRADTDPELLAARRDLAALNLEAAVRKALAEAPRPSDAQLDAIAALLRTGGGASGR